MKLFAVSQPGIEEITYKELKSLGINGEKLPGGIEFEGDLKELYLTNLWLRSASRILIRLCSFKAKHFAELVRKATKCNWQDFITPQLPIKIRVTSKKSKLYHTKAIEERILKAIKEKLNFTPKLAKFEDEGTSVIVRFENDICTISVNSSGPLLHKRGYRVAKTEAPLRENLAAAMLLVANYDGSIPLIDPFCGSGTIPIEGALIASQTPPGINRNFAFMKWKNFNENLWKELIRDATSQTKHPQNPIIGIDINPKAINAAEKNAKAAKMDKFLTFKNASFPNLNLSKALIVTNLPYGERLKEKRLELLYRYFGDWIRKNFKEATVYFLTNKLYLAKAVSQNVKEVIQFSNGGIPVKLYTFTHKTQRGERNESI